MPENKTKRTNESVRAFLAKIPDEQKRRDASAIVKMMQELVGAEPKMWGPSIVGFGDMSYKTADGKKHDWFPVGFSPRKQNLALYLMSGLEAQGELLKKLGKYKTGKGCLYINRLEDVDIPTLRAMIKDSVGRNRKRYE